MSICTAALRHRRGIYQARRNATESQSRSRSGPRFSCIETYGRSRRRHRLGDDAIRSRSCPGSTASRPVSRVLSGGYPPRWSFVWDACCQTPQAANPGDEPENGPEITPRSRAAHLRSPLFGLAPGGVYPAISVARYAVRSYRTLSPLPRTACRRAAAVCFLWHFPWGRPRRPLAATVFPWSPDFPPSRPLGKAHGGTATIQPTGRPP